MAKWRQVEGKADAGRVVCLGLAALLLAATTSLGLWLLNGQRHPLLLAPAIGGLNDCLMPQSVQAQPHVCRGDAGSAAPLVEQVLGELGPARDSAGTLEVGYTLVVPLLKLFQQDGSGAWRLDDAAVRRVARTVQGVDRPVVLYFFSTHFSEGAPIEAALARDPENLAETSAGPLPPDRYFGIDIFPWSIARTDNGITRQRERAMSALAEALCALPRDTQARIRAINLLGEVHHLYPNFEQGMGVDQPYVITDYSAASRRAFRRYLASRFHGVAELNAHLGADYASFDAVNPPSRDIRRERLDHFFEHIDASAHGRLSVVGWLHDRHAEPSHVGRLRVFVDGEPVGRPAANAWRQDVVEARADLGTGAVGWRQDLMFDTWSPALHRIDVALERPDRSLLHLATRRVAIMDRTQTTPVPQPMRQALPRWRSVEASDGIDFAIDEPDPRESFYYNPLVPLWHAFRKRQVVDYIAHFDRLLSQTCLRDIPRRTQQILPARNAGWDDTRFAAETSTLPFGRVGLGINLYGEATHDAGFFDWLARTRQPGYAVTEFHPLRGLDGVALRDVLMQHRDHGATSLSFFLQRSDPAAARAAPLNPFAFDAHNPRFGSDTLYRSVQSVLRGDAAR